MWLCLDCGKETEPNEELIYCPNCGSDGVPADTSKRLNISITWHELRCIVMWAERWASSSSDKKNSERLLRVVYGIADRIQVQHLDQECGLTFASELSELRAHITGTIEQNVIREIDPPKLPD